MYFLKNDYCCDLDFFWVFWTLKLTISSSTSGVSRYQSQTNILQLWLETCWYHFDNVCIALKQKKSYFESTISKTLLLILNHSKSYVHHKNVFFFAMLFEFGSFLLFRCGYNIEIYLLITDLLCTTPAVIYIYGWTFPKGKMSEKNFNF